MEKDFSKNDELIERKPETAGIQSHAWRGVWSRPLRIPEQGQHPFTIARMTDHNVKGRD